MCEDTFDEKEASELEPAEEDTGLVWGRVGDIPPSRMGMALQTFRSAVEHVVVEEVARTTAASRIRE